MSLPSPLSQLKLPIFEQKQLNVYVKRDDLIDPIISGNKWRKLSGSLRHAKTHGLKGLVSFGGAYSNHIHALAYACRQHNLASVGIIRGRPDYSNNFTLSMARSWGMSLQFVSHLEYKQRAQRDYLEQLQIAYPDYLIVPEGGSHQLALSGVAEVITELEQQIDYQHILLPVGSGGTIAGLVQQDKNQHNILGIAVLKQAEYLNQVIASLLGQAQTSESRWQLLTQYHGGGYAKFSETAVEQLVAYNKQSGITFEPIYSGKMLLAAIDLAEQDYFAAGETLVLLHTGGLQGIGGLLEQGRLAKNDWSVPNFD